MYFRHSQLRKGQKEIMEDVAGALQERKHLLIHAPTGCGKTDAVLSPVAEFALREGLDVFFLTPKISQHAIALEVLRGLASKHALEFRATDLIGKRHLCTDASLKDLDSDSFYSVCDRRKHEERCPFYRRARGYSAREIAEANFLFRKMKSSLPSILSHSEIFRGAGDFDACAYELASGFVKESQFVVTDYFLLAVPFIRSIFLSRSGKRLSNSIILVDEAHNLAPRIREQQTRNAGHMLFKRAEMECRLLGEKLPLASIARKISRWVTDDSLVEKKPLLEIVGKYIDYKELVGRLEDAGGAYVERAGKRSSCLSLSRFLDAWAEDGNEYVRLARRRTDGFLLTRLCLDASGAASFLNEAHSSILMSGTLTPLEMHRDLLGLPQERTLLKEYPSPFPKDNTLPLLSPLSTTKFSRRNMEEYKRIASIVSSVIEATPGGVGVFFPSYEVMDGVLPSVSTRRPMFLQKRNMKPAETSQLLSSFVSSEKGVLCGVQGGSLSEGIDLPGSLKCAVMVGIALEEMSLEVEARINYCEEKLGKGWSYGYLYPAVIKALQAAGRCVRDEKDRAVLVFLDERFRWKNYSSCFPKDFVPIVSTNPANDAKVFWSNK